MAEEYVGLTCQSLCDALSTLKGAYEATNTDFNLYWSVGEWGKGVHSISESVHVVLSDTISMLKHQQAEIERLKAQKQKWLQNIADQQLAVSPTGYETEEGLAKRTGEWNGLQMAWEILTKE